MGSSQSDGQIRRRRQPTSTKPIVMAMAGEEPRNPTTPNKIDETPHVPQVPITQIEQAPKKKPKTARGQQPKATCTGEQARFLIRLPPPRSLQLQQESKKSFLSLATKED
ncbi:hypothetical protein E2562_026295 [Oryza meyeriana var. granulata]|uniref:Uncharacterized protein n=1 Tax=Oryza meyeriana var. granulata TaxID=110450 RepID=A0A6G1C8P7_9ORYZ|nr:hypothetical protein E2562_026295 [Oryza meyeriana var. granulata]